MLTGINNIHTNLTPDKMKIVFSKKMIKHLGECPDSEEFIQGLKELNIELDETTKEKIQKPKVKKKRPSKEKPG